LADPSSRLLTITEEENMFERHHEPLLSRRAFAIRIARYMALASAIVLTSLGVGTLGYRVLGGLSWVDGLVNSAMLLGGMGQVESPQTTIGKLFSAGFALYSGLVFVVATIVMTPIVHRVLHHFHVGEEANSKAT
jgi:hypothetical protein